MIEKILYCIMAFTVGVIGTYMLQLVIEQVIEHNKKKKEEKKADQRIDQIFACVKLIQSRVDQLHNRISKDNDTCNRNNVEIAQDIQDILDRMNGMNGLYIGKELVDRCINIIEKSGDESDKEVINAIKEEVKVKE